MDGRGCGGKGQENPTVILEASSRFPQVASLRETSSRAGRLQTTMPVTLPTPSSTHRMLTLPRDARRRPPGCTQSRTAPKRRGDPGPRVTAACASPNLLFPPRLAPSPVQPLLGPSRRELSWMPPFPHTPPPTHRETPSALPNTPESSARLRGPCPLPVAITTLPVPALTPTWRPSPAARSALNPTTPWLRSQALRSPHAPRVPVCPPRLPSLLVPMLGHSGRRSAPSSAPSHLLSLCPELFLPNGHVVALHPRRPSPRCPLPGSPSQAVLPPAPPTPSTLTALLFLGGAVWTP